MLIKLGVIALVDASTMQLISLKLPKMFVLYPDLSYVKECKKMAKLLLVKGHPFNTFYSVR